MEQEEALELEGLTVAHQLAPTEDDHVVADDENARLLQSRHGGDAGLELEIIGRISHDGSECLVEDGP